MADQPRVVGIFLFDGFEPLDVFGPVEVFGVIGKRFKLVLLGPQAGPVRSSSGQQVIPDHAWDDDVALDIVLVPGGLGTRREASNERLLSALRKHARTAELTTSVCTGSGLLAAAGLLDGKRATSNKLAFAWVRSQGPRVEWVPEARWVEDGDVVTSAGVTAGIDMALAIVARLHGRELAEGVANGIEHEWHSDPSWDPFARRAGLV